MAHRNKIAGSKWNYKVINFFSEVFDLIPFNNKNHSEFTVSTAQAMSKPLDGLGVDIYFKDSLPKWIKNIYVQCKTTQLQTKSTYTIDVKPLLDMKIKGINLLFTEVTKKQLTKKGEISKNKSVVTELVTMELETFKVFLEAYKAQCKAVDIVKDILTEIKTEENENNCKG